MASKNGKFRYLRSFLKPCVVDFGQKWPFFAENRQKRLRPNFLVDVVWDSVEEKSDFFQSREWFRLLRLLKKVIPSCWNFFFYKRFPKSCMSSCAAYYMYVLNCDRLPLGPTPSSRSRRQETSWLENEHCSFFCPPPMWWCCFCHALMKICCQKLSRFPTYPLSSIIIKVCVCKKGVLLWWQLLF